MVDFGSLLAADYAAIHSSKDGHPITIIVANDRLRSRLTYSTSFDLPEVAGIGYRPYNWTMTDCREIYPVNRGPT